MKKYIAHKRKKKVYVVVRGLKRTAFTLDDAIALAKRRVASRRPGHSHTQLVMRAAAVVSLQQVMVVKVERVPHR
jgi:hypothetical protein